jgi:hypothetical protein
MFIRKKFVTNSSSTSFIAFGTRIENTPWGKDRYTYDEWFKNETGISCWSKECSAEIFYESEYNEGALFIKESRWPLEGFSSIPHSKDEPEWAEQLQEFCEKLGIPCEPTWFAWYSGG